jgi:hypothetical protein
VQRFFADFSSNTVKKPLPIRIKISKRDGLQKSRGITGIFEKGVLEL